MCGGSKEGGRKGKVISLFIPSGIYQLYSPPKTCLSLTYLFHAFSFLTLYRELAWHSGWAQTFEASRVGFALSIYHLLGCPINTYYMNEWENNLTSLSLGFLIWKHK